MTYKMYYEMLTSVMISFQSTPMTKRDQMGLNSNVKNPGWTLGDIDSLLELPKFGTSFHRQ